MRIHAAPLGVVLSFCIVAGLSMSAQAELGWTEADYVEHFGPAPHSPVTPNELRFTAAGGPVQVLFENGRSREEAWIIEKDTAFVPADLRRLAETAMQGQPARRVVFHAERAPAAEVFEARSGDVMVQVDVRNHAIARIVRCRSTGPCELLNHLLDMDRITDDLMARTQAQLRREGH
jgi:hypothetical protein